MPAVTFLSEAAQSTRPTQPLPAQPLTSGRDLSPSEIDPSNSDQARTLIHIRPVEAGIVAMARHIAGEISKRSHEGVFGDTFIRRALEILPSAAQDPSWQKVLALAGYFTIRASGESYSFARNIPRGLLDPSTEHHDERVGTLIRYAFVNRLGYDSARKIETLSNFHPLLKSVGLKGYMQHHCVGALKFFELGFPAETAGEDPAIRIWKLDVPRKWTGPEGAALATRATAWMLRFGENMVTKNDDGSFSFDLARMRNVVWHEVFERYGMRSLIENEAAGLRTYRDALTAGAALLGRPDLFGYRDDQLRPNVVRPRSRWIGEGGDEDRRVLAEALWRDIRSKYPQAFDPEGAPIPSQLKQIRDWSSLFRIPRASGIALPFGNLRGFLQHTTPEIFGWESWQIKPWEMDLREGKWLGPEGRQLFVSSLAYVLALHGLGRLTVRGNRLDYDLTSAQLEQWKTRCDSGEISTALRDFIPKHGLAGGLTYAAHSSVNCALGMLFGEDESGELLSNVRNKTNAKVLSALLSKHGGGFRLALAHLSDEDTSNLLANDPHLEPERTDPDTLLLRHHPRPLLHKKFAILTKHDITLWRELRIDPGLDRKLQEGFFGNRSWKGTPMEDVQNHSPERALLLRLLTTYRERGTGTKILPLAVELLPERDELRTLLELVRLKLIDSLNLQASAATQLQETLLRVTQAPLHPGRILSDCREIQRRGTSQEPSMLDLLEASVLFAIKVEAARGS